MLSRLSQGSADAGVGSPAGLRYHVEASSLEPDLTLTRNYARDYAETQLALSRESKTSSYVLTYLYRTKPVSKIKECFSQLPRANVGLPLFTPDATHRNEKTQTQQTNQNQGKQDVPSSCVVFAKSG